MIRKLIMIMTSSLAIGNAPAAPLVVLKLDDMNVTEGKVPERWQRIIRFAEERRMKTSIGIIGNSLEGDHPGYVSEIKRAAATGLFEFWHHGFDHRRWQENGTTLYEFSGTGKEHQSRHFQLGQDLAKQKLGITYQTFGAPFNTTDEVTIEVLSASPEIRVWLQGDTKQPAGKLVVTMVDNVNIEQPVHKPNFDAFVKGYEALKGNHPPVLILQGHPNSWDDAAFDQYTQILGFLDAKGCRYVFPAELPTLLK